MDFEQGLSEIETKIAELAKPAEGADPSAPVEPSPELVELRKKRDEMLRDVYGKLTPWQTVQVARHANRPVFADYVRGVFTEFLDLHGDRCFGDDPALQGGFASIGNERLMLIGMEKGKGVDDKVKANFGMANPEGYRKALRLMRLAEKFRVPIVCLVDTPAAYPGKEAEERGQAEAIARNITEMSLLETPIVVVITGEGGSGGALGIAVGDVVLMLSHAIYSVIPPEGCAAILWRDANRAPEAAEALKLTAPELLKLKVIDGIVREPLGGAHRDHAATFAATKTALLTHLKKLKDLSAKKLVERRYEKFAKIGKYHSRSHAKH
jgi:acetyl-CoA carboxylase carboxyl transferase subunit alpha